MLQWKPQSLSALSKLQSRVEKSPSHLILCWRAEQEESSILTHGLQNYKAGFDYYYLLTSHISSIRSIITRTEVIKCLQKNAAAKLSGLLAPPLENALWLCHFSFPSPDTSCWGHFQNSFARGGFIAPDILAEENKSVLPCGSQGLDKPFQALFPYPDQFTKPALLVHDMYLIAEWETDLETPLEHPSYSRL